MKEISKKIEVTAVLSALSVKTRSVGFHGVSTVGAELVHLPLLDLLKTMEVKITVHK
jgi:hypothetical protein